MKRVTVKVLKDGKLIFEIECCIDEIFPHLMLEKGYEIQITFKAV